MLNRTKFLARLVALVFLSIAILPSAHAAGDGKVVDYYKIQPGDVLMVSVWREETMSGDVIVRPDGQITFPLVGELSAAGSTICRLSTATVMSPRNWLRWSRNHTYRPGLPWYRWWVRQVV